MRSGQGLCVYTALPGHSAQVLPVLADSDQTWVRVGIQGLEKGGGCVSSIINGPYKGLITCKPHLMDCTETGGSRGCWTSVAVKKHARTDTHMHEHKHMTCARGASYHQAVGSVKGSL